MGIRQLRRRRCRSKSDALDGKDLAIGQRGGQRRRDGVTEAQSDVGGTEGGGHGLLGGDQRERLAVHPHRDVPGREQRDLSFRERQPGGSRNADGLGGAVTQLSQRIVNGGCGGPDVAAGAVDGQLELSSAAKNDGAAVVDRGRDGRRDGIVLGDCKVRLREGRDNVTTTS